MDYLANNYKYIFFALYSLPFIKGVFSHRGVFTNKDWGKKPTPWKVADLIIIITFPITALLLITNYNIGYYVSVASIVSAQILPLTIFRSKFGFSNEHKKVANGILLFWLLLIALSSAIYFY
ncbi:hypothetical protein CWB99_07740 [Pseudoalteromonas rubra]|uniref:Uncharacterized protein n=1 Tax=Pseudoalteromonas rubra TaxID=43658 RepID=A0A5S3WNQ8_9GAMM|nr:hypothetical protein [Pseudoalteromonas rubra]TMP29972.1 hypothetical protein CWB99_07740 [Pseudoalteromonas rubra]TMP32200.1 hypothetical protein CWC00_13465 [Pseudoalteromonas rubra]